MLRFTFRQLEYLVAVGEASSAGRQLFLHAQELLNQASAMRDTARDIAGSVLGPLAIGCLLSFAQAVLPGLRRQFEIVVPEVQITQSELDQTEIFNKIRRAEIDLALTYDLDLPA